MEGVLIVQWVLMLGLLFLFVRYFSHEELDDVHPRVQSTNDPLLRRSKWLWVMPLYMNDPISKHPNWVKRIKRTGKKIGLHGVRHTFNEFGHDLPEDYIKKGIDEFTKAFGYPPKHFKAPKLSLTPHNRRIIEKYGMEIKGRLNQLLHQAHHNWEGRMTDGTNRLPGEYYTHGEEGDKR